MQLMVTGRHVAVTEPMKEYAREKLARIVHERPQVNEVHLIMDVEKYRHRVEVTVRGRHLDLFCREETHDMYASIDRALTKLDRLLHRHKERRARRRQAPLREVAPAEAFPPAAEEPSLSRRLAMQPMYAREALLQLKVERHLFFAFLNEETGEVNLAYRLGEGRIGLLSPKRVRGPDRAARFRLTIFKEEAIGPDGRLRHLRADAVDVGWASPEEAVASIAASGGTYRFFMNTAAGAPSLVYAQEDGGYALIEPRP
ncbi:MAG: ribosome-associated translation inhibitor RaiA [bacterium]|nr:ribosome-associated translation inhibitor RaiA [bacterium]